MPPILLVDALVQGLVLHLGVGLLREPRGQLVRGGVDLGAELEEVGHALAVDAAILDRRTHRATGLFQVLAVVELALRGQRLDIGEALGHGLLAGRLQLAHARRIDHAGAGRQRDQRAVGGGVATAFVAFAHRAGLHHFAAAQGVGQGRLAGAGAAHQHDGLAVAQPRGQRDGTFRILGIQRQHRRAQRAQLVQRRLDIGAVLVGLGQHHHRLHAAAADQHQVALDPARIEIRIQPTDHEHGIDVGRDHLLLVVLAGRAALDRGKAGQQGDDAQCIRPLAFDQHPVADRGPRFRRDLALAVTAAALPFRQRLRAMRDINRLRHVITAAVLLGDAGRAGLGMRGHQRSPDRIEGRRRPAPADGLQGVHARRMAVMRRF